MASYLSFSKRRLTDIIFKDLSLVERFLKGLEKLSKRENWNKRLKRVFSQVKNFNNSIFLAHDAPLNHLDKILNKSPLHGVNLGDEYYLKYIKQYQPTVYVCGHFHEHSQKTSKIGKTLLINPGEAGKGQFAILELKDNKLKLKFYK